MSKRDHFTKDGDETYINDATGEKINKSDLIDKVVEAMRQNIQDVTDLKQVAYWATRYATNAYKDGYRQGRGDTMIELVKMFLLDDNQEQVNALNLGAELHRAHARAGGGTPRGRSPDQTASSHGVSGGAGAETGEGIRHSAQAAGDSLRSVGEGDSPTRQGTSQD